MNCRDTNVDGRGHGLEVSMLVFVRQEGVVVFGAVFLIRVIKGLENSMNDKGSWDFLGAKGRE